MDTSAIRETVALARRVPPPDFVAHSRKVALAETKIKNMQGLLEGLLGVEAEARQTIECRLIEAQSRHQALTRDGVQFQKLEKICNVHQRLSLEPLTWRDARGFPRLVVFSLTSPICRLAAMPNNVFLVEPPLPQNITKQYEDVLQLLAAKRQKQKGLELVCRFEGMIPREVRKKIDEARGLFGRYIFIVAEPGSFTLNEITPLPKGDPLVVGYDPDVDEDGLWLIADFDVTTVEEAMVHYLAGGRS